jgi:hypothetical protein
MKGEGYSKYSAAFSIFHAFQTLSLIAIQIKKDTQECPFKFQNQTRQLLYCYPHNYFATVVSVAVVAVVVSAVVVTKEESTEVTSVFSAGLLLQAERITIEVIINAKNDFFIFLVFRLMNEAQI